MNQVLVTYATMAGSTAEVAQAVADELSERRLQVSLRPLAEVDDLAGYDAVVLGAPMILGWHRAALRFLRKNRRGLEDKLLALFVTCLSLTEADEPPAELPRLFIDPQLPKPPANSGRLSLRERYTRLANYLRPILRATRSARLTSLAFFGGRLEFGRLKWWAVLFAWLIVRAAPGDRRNWEAIRSWAAGLPQALGLEQEPTAQAV